MILVLLKATLLFCFPLSLLPFLRRSPASVRHLICVMALAASVLLPFTLLVPADAAPLRIALSAGPAAIQAIEARPTLNIPLVLWALGVAFCLVRIAAGLVRVMKVRRSATRLQANVWEADVSVPCACGLVRSAILLPRGAGAWPGGLRKAAIRHEAAHLERRDLWTGLMAEFACAVYWFHPLVWPVNSALKREQELACDDRVLSSGFEPVGYAEALLAAAHLATKTHSLIGCSMLTQKTLRIRIARLLDPAARNINAPAKLSRNSILTGAALLIIAMLHPLLEQQPPYRAGQNGVSAPRVIRKVDPAYTPNAEANKIEGTVLLKVVIGTSGLAENIEVVKGLDPDLDANAIRAVQTWQFEPGKLNGAPVPVTAQIEVNFRIQ